MIEVLFFARLREQLGTGRVSVPFQPGMTLAGLLDGLGEAHGDAWLQALGADNVIRAVNQVVVADDQPLQDGDEVAFFPPVTGG